MDEYSPEPFPPAFPATFDPRADVYEVVERLASGKFRVASSSWQIWDVSPAQLAPGLVLAPGDRVVGVLEVELPARLWGRLLRRQRTTAPSLRLEPLRPNRTELAFVERWLHSLREARLRIDDLDLSSLLIERLRTLPLGLHPIPPLRQLLRDVLEALVGCFPPRGGFWSVDEAVESVRALLAELGVPVFTPPVLPRVEPAWPIVPLLVEAANQALQRSASPLQLVPCEPEVFSVSLDDADGDAIERPVWLVLAPDALPALEAAQILRRYRGAVFPASTGAVDPRVLRLRVAIPELVSRGEVPPRPTVPSAPAAPLPRPAAVRSLAPTLPCRATIRSYVAMDAVGELVTDDGIAIPFGATACKGFAPAAGMDVWLVAVVPHPRGHGHRAAVVNLTGQSETTRLEELKEANQRKQAQADRERAFLVRHRLIGTGDDDDGYDWTTLLARSAADRRAIAAGLVELKRTSHVFDELFEDLAIVDAEALHPHLAALDWRREPESLAWARAPFTALAFAEAALSRRGDGSLREEVPIGAHGPGREMRRRDRAPADDAGAAALALARSADPEAIRRLSRWLSDARIPADTANDLLIIAGWQLHDGRLAPLWGHRPAFCVQRSPDGRAHLFEASDRRCTICGDSLLCLLRDPSARIVPFPVFTCARCVVSASEPYHVEVSAAGTPTSLIDADRPDDPLVEPRGLPVAVAVTLESAPWAVPPDVDEFERVTRVGGWPSWLQSPISAGDCPRCDMPMEFLAQFPDPPADLWGDECWGGRTGMLYVFACRRCRVAASFQQHR